MMLVSLFHTNCMLQWAIGTRVWYIVHVVGRVIQVHAGSRTILSKTGQEPLRMIQMVLLKHGHSFGALVEAANFQNILKAGAFWSILGDGQQNALVTWGQWPGKWCTTPRRQKH